MQGNQLLGGVPGFGGTDDHGSTAFRVMGDGPVPKPRELVRKLDEYVIGQDVAKKAGPQILLSMQSNTFPCTAYAVVQHSSRLCVDHCLQS